MAPLSHSMSAPTFSHNSFSNTTYSYSYSPLFQSSTPTPNAAQVTSREDIQRLVFSGAQSTPNSLVTKSKESNNDLIDLIDAIESKDVLQLFDPLLIDLNAENNNLNFSNNFELDSESSANDDAETSPEEILPVSFNHLISGLNMLLKTSDKNWQFRVFSPKKAIL